MAGEVSCGTSAALVPDLVLIFWPSSYDEGFQVYGLGLSGDGFGSGMNMKRLFSIHLGNTCGTGFAVSGSKLVAVGSTWTETPKECWIWDLTDWRNKDEFNCRKIQTLAEKPQPLVFEHSGRVFALAGLGHTGGNTPNPVFEVCDVSDGGEWRGLPDPPFVDEYCKEDPREMKSHTVIGKKLYLGLCYAPLHWVPLRQGNGSFDIGGGGAIPTLQKRWEYYTYDIEGGTWDKIIDTDSSMVDPVVKNFMNHCWSEKIDYVDDDLMVFTSRRNKEVFACDLNSDLPEPVLEEEEVVEVEVEEADDDGDEASSSMPDETGSLDEMGSLDSADLEEYNEKRKLVDEDDSGSDGLLPFEEPLSDSYLPVQGLDIKKKTPKSFANSHMVAHLAGDIYCAVFLNLPYEVEDECQKIHVTTFRVLKEERSIKATVLDSKDFTADMVLNLEAWCKLRPVQQNPSSVQMHSIPWLGCA